MIDINKTYNLHILVYNKEFMICKSYKKTSIKEIIDNHFKNEKVNINIDKNKKEILIYSVYCPLHLIIEGVEGFN